MMFLPPDYQHDESGDKSAKTRNGGIAFPNFGDTASNIVILLGGICGVISLVALEVLGTAKGATAGERSPSEEWQLNTCLPSSFWRQWPCQLVRRIITGIPPMRPWYGTVYQ